MIDQRVIITKKNNSFIILLLQKNDLLACEIIGNESKKDALCLGRIEKVDTKTGSLYVKTDYGINAHLPIKKQMYLNGELSTKSPKQGDTVAFFVEKEETELKLIGGSTDLSVSGRFLVISAGTGVHFSKKLSDETIHNIKEFTEKHEIGNNVHVIFRSSCKKLKKEQFVYFLEEYEVLSEKLLSFIGRCKNEREMIHEYSVYSEILHFIDDLDDNRFDEIVTDDAKLHEVLSKSSYAVTHKVRLYEDTAYSLAKLYDVDNRLHMILERRIHLKSGANIVIDVTEAFIVIDVNSAKSTEYYKNKDIAFEVNKEACIEIYKQIQLRNLCGIILVDFINMSSKEKEEELLLLMNSLAKEDKQKLLAIDITCLGIMQLTRKKKSMMTESKIMSLYEKE